MSLANDIVALAKAGSDQRDSNQPEAWRPRLELGPEGGFVVSTPRQVGNQPEAADILNEFDLDPDQWTVTGVRRSRWQKYDGDWLEAYRLTVVPAGASQREDKDLAQLIEQVAKWRPSKGVKTTHGDLAHVWAFSDEQLGKKQGDRGTDGTVQRILDVTNGAVQRYKDLRKLGRNLGTVVIASLGDHVEGGTSQGGRLRGQAASDLGVTQQVRLARRLLLARVKAAVSTGAENVVVAVINGNHDEETRQVAADATDGWNVDIAASVQDICAENPELAHVQFRYPEANAQTLTVNVCGHLLGLFHGHQVRGDVVKYLSQQSVGQTSLGSADTWLSGHYHHLAIKDIGHRLWAQATTLDPGSDWFRDSAGLDSHAGLLTLTIGAGFNPRQDICVIPAVRS